MNRRRIVVSGAGGLLGTRVIELLCDNYEVHALIHSEPISRVGSVVYHLIDLSDGQVFQTLPHRVHAVIHLAQSSKFREFPESALNIFNVNVAATARLLEYARSAEASIFVYASSGGLYGGGEGPFQERSPVLTSDNLGYYLGSKVCGEVLTRSYENIFTTIILRFFFIYGKRQKRTMLLPRLMDNILMEHPIKLDGELGIKINPIHVDDASAAVLRALTLKANSLFNICGDDVFSIKQIADAMGKYLGKEVLFDIQRRDSRDLIGDNTMMKKCLVKPTRSLLDNFKDIAN